MKQAMYRFLLISSLLLLFLSFSGCGSTHASKSISFKVDTGDKIQITVDLKKGYDLGTETPFVISKDDEEISTGTFAQPEAYDYYYQGIKSGEFESAEILDEGTKDKNDYFFYKYSTDTHTEYNYIIKVNDSNTVILLGNLISEDEANDCFEALTFSIDK